tara:strand:+ start:170 stop:478 length:309 start_codon:yes stop_codon:yes gene_type:complete
MAQDRVYINQCSLREKVFDNGGSLINAAFKVSELQEHTDENGWVNIVIAKRREVSEKGATHYAYKSEYQRNTNQPMTPAEPQSTTDQGQGVMPDSMDDDLPF